jgi:ribonuclease Z
VRITLLGTGSPIPDPDRAGPSTLVQAGATNLLVDAGRGVAMRLAGAGLFPVQLSAVLVTHLHSDHISDLNDVITSRWVMSPAPAPLRIYGPPRTGEVVDAILAMLAPDIAYRLAHHDDLTEPPRPEVVEVVDGDTFEVDDVVVTVGRTDHRPVEPTVAFRVAHEGRAVVLGGDGVPCDELTALCRGADAYVQTVVRDDLVRQVPMARFNDILDYHSSVEDAGRTAAAAGVRTLVLTHYVPAIAPGAHDEWRARAAAHFDGEVVVPDDGHVVEVGS